MLSQLVLFGMTSATVAGGFYLMQASGAEIQTIIKDLKALGVRSAAPSHRRVERSPDQLDRLLEYSTVRSTN